MAFDLTDYAEAVNNGLFEGSPCVLVTVGADGTPDVGLKGSMMVFDADHLAYWERTLRQHLDNLRQSSKVAVLYRNATRKMYVRFFGEAAVYEEGPVREQVMARTIEPELARDPERKGCGVLIKVHTIADQGKGTLRREE